MTLHIYIQTEFWVNLLLGHKIDICLDVSSKIPLISSQQSVKSWKFGSHFYDSCFKNHTKLHEIQIVMLHFDIGYSLC